MVLLFCPENIDKLRCLEIALVHDLAEIYAGDYTPVDDISPEDKHNKELDAIKFLSKELSYPRFIDLFNEYEMQESKEALFIKGLDKIDNVLTAAYYDKHARSEHKLVPEFGNHSLKSLQLIKLKELDDVKTIVQHLVK
jgi:putative hydrolase of HD superfamily